MEIQIESKEEWMRLCKKAVSESMVRISEEDEAAVVRLMEICFEAGYNLAKNESTKVEV